MGELIRPIRAYLDTSVFGGVFDEEFAEASRAIFQYVQTGRIRVLIGSVTDRELAGAPERVRLLRETLAPASVEACAVTAEVEALRDEYLNARVLSRKWVDDTTHVALATVYRADMLVSWNFKHLVRWDRVRAFNALNFLRGYGALPIVSPPEVRFEEDL